MKILLLVWTSILISSIFLLTKIPSNFNSEANPGIVVRESTIDIQVRVGEKLFVFGKTQGTLDKIKVGMHVLNFAQNPKISGASSNFNQVTWKKLKDGSIQIQSTYKPWPAQLTWLVLPSGQLKMLASSLISDQDILPEMGLGFDLPENELRKVFLDNSEWDISQENERKSSFQVAKLEFDYVSLSIQSVSNPLTIGSDFKNVNAEKPDLVFHRPADFHTSVPASPGAAGKQSVSSKISDSMILLFDFQ